MDDEIKNTPPAPPKPKQKRPARRRPAKAAAAKKPPGEFEGISALDCCSGCTAQRCIITGMAICGHPMKGGIQAPLMIKPDIMRRYHAAKQVLAHAKLDEAFA